MAKMFYTLEETRAALGQSEDQIKQLTRDGRLREFRDGPRLMFKSDQVEALKSQIGGGGLEPIDLADSSIPLSLADSSAGTGAGMSLADSLGSGVSPGSGLAGIGSGSGLAGIAGSGLGSGLAGSPGSGMMNLKEDTALAADLGLSGTIGGLPSPGRTGGSMSGGSYSSGSVAGGSMSGGSVSGGTVGGSVGGGSVGGRQGINVFGDDTNDEADPMAQTSMPTAGGMDLNLEGIGSGSGLLDLTRESDDTSLGAELLDEISPSGRARPMAPADTGSMAGVQLEAPRGGVVRGSTGVTLVEARDTWAPAFGGAALGAGLVLLFAIFALFSGLVDVNPGSVGYFADKSFGIIIAFGLGIALVFGAFGKLIAMSMGR